MSDDQNAPQSSLGEFLRHERERRGITIEQVASATKINVRLLHLLESDQYSELPAKPFIRGFVNSYCRFIGVDPKEVLIRFGDFLEVKSHDRPTRDQGHSGYAFEKREGEQSRTFLGIAMGAFVILGGLAFVILKPSLHHHHNSHAEKLREANASASPEVSASPGALESGSPLPSPSVSVVMVPVPTSVPATITFSPSPSPKPSPKPSPSPKPTPTASEEASDPLNSGVNLKGSEIKYKVILRTERDVWVRYRVDERPKMKFILRAGKILVLRAQKEALFQTSDSDQVTFRINGGSVRNMLGDQNVAERHGDLTLIVPKELVGTTQDPFPGERTLKGAFVPGKKAPTSEPSESP